MAYMLSDLISWTRRHWYRAGLVAIRGQAYSGRITYQRPRLSARAEWPGHLPSLRTMATT